ncbi:MAG: lipopolysaccharide heptosyltransferase II [Verrucomicrobia bacterium]|nr:MAG: lipopolysaccharide heptosyltransferase II [Verrucomicrobiota bacterium]
MDRVVFALYRALSALLCALPLTAVFRLGWALGSLAYWVAPPYRRLVLHNLTIAFGREKSPAELRALARKHFATLGANIFSNVKLPTLTADEIRAVVTVEGLETLQEGSKIGCGYVMVISHLGSWEMFAQLSPIFFGCKVGTIFQALSNPHIDAEVRRDRARLGLELFERKAGFIKAGQFMREGGAVGILMDQHAGDAGLWCPFFGRLASTTTLPATLALRTGAWLVPAAVHTAGVARWHCIIQPPVPTNGEDADAITARLNPVLEAQIRHQPADWFWVHNRWKTPRPKFLLATYKRGIARDQNALQPFRILLRASNWLGDAVMSVPAVRAIKRGRPEAHVSVLTPAKLADFWKSVAEVDEVIAIEAGENIFGVAQKIRRNFDAAILLPNSLRTALEVWLAGIPRRVGVPGHHRRWLLNQVFAPKKKKVAERPHHQVHDYLALAEFVGADVEGALDIFTRNQKPETRNPIIGLCAGAEYGAAKRWLPERFAETMRLVHEKTGCEWKLFGVEKDRPAAAAILATAGVPSTDLIGKTTLAQLMDELRTCDLLLTNDTGTMHLAAHLGVPVVALFGSTEPRLTGPLGPGHRILRHHVECSPCFLRECPLDFRCMKAIEVPEVVAAIEATLAHKPVSS